MPLIRVNDIEGELRLHESGGAPLPHLAEAARRGDGPVIVMVHGFKFRPYAGRDCPHSHIFGLEDGPCWKARSWPRALGFGAAARDEGLALAFGWNSRGMIWDVYRRAEVTGAALARLIAVLRRAAPWRPVHAICHSLGVRVVLQALAHLAPGDIGRIIALNGAEFAGAAQSALACGAGQGAEIVAVTGRENASYELMLERFVAPARRGDRAMGRGLAEEGVRQVMLRLDRAAVRARLAALGFPLGDERRRICHWSPYLRDGAMDFYAALMRRPESLPLTALHVPAPPEQDPSRRWLPLPRFQPGPACLREPSSPEA